MSGPKWEETEPLDSSAPSWDETAPSGAQYERPIGPPQEKWGDRIVEQLRDPDRQQEFLTNTGPHRRENETMSPTDSLNRLVGEFIRKREASRGAPP